MAKKVIVIHGNNTLYSRQKLNTLIMQAKVASEIIRLSGNNLSLNDFIQAVNSQPFFKKEKLVVIENFFSRPDCKEKEEIFLYVQRKTLFSQLIFWEKNALSPKILNKIPSSWKVEGYNASLQVFKFLDNFRPQNIKNHLNFLISALKKESEQLIFILFCYRIRDLIIALTLGEKGLKGKAFWQQKKLIMQAHYFSLEQLKKIYQRLLFFDIRNKKGENLLSLSDQLIFLVADLN